MLREVHTCMYVLGYFTSGEQPKAVVWHLIWHLIKLSWLNMSRLLGPFERSLTHMGI